MASTAALRPLWLSGIVDCKGKRKITTDSFIASKAATLNSPPNNGIFTIYAGNRSKMVEYFSHEVDRFATASFESLQTHLSNPAFPRSTGWLIIRGYYAAFFALHALMRLHGWGCIRLSASSASILEKENRLFFPGGEPICGGHYLIRASNSNSEIVFERLGSGSKGSHEAAWDLLPSFMTYLTDKASLHPVYLQESQQLTAHVLSARSLLSKHGGPAWLSRVRNNVNYSHAYGAWHPYERSTCNLSRVQTALDRWKLDPAAVLLPSTKDELLIFCEICAYLVSLCRETMTDVIYRSKPTSPFSYSTAHVIAN